MYFGGEKVRALEARYGTPPRLRWEYSLGEPEYRMVRASQRGGRAHDITLFIFRGPHLAVIRKPSFPPGAYRAPSGGLHPEEGFEAGVRREAREETGLEIELDRYLLRVEVRFRWNDQVIDWTTHVFSARAMHERLAPQDHEEIAEARWATVEELQGPIRRALLGPGLALFAYRVALTDATLEVLAAQTRTRSASGSTANP